MEDSKLDNNMCSDDEKAEIEVSTPETPYAALDKSEDPQLENNLGCDDEKAEIEVSTPNTPHAALDKSEDELAGMTHKAKLRFLKKAYLGEIADLFHNYVQDQCRGTVYSITQHRSGPHAYGDHKFRVWQGKYDNLTKINRAKKIMCQDIRRQFGKIREIWGVTNVEHPKHYIMSYVQRYGMKTVKPISMTQGSGGIIMRFSFNGKTFIGEGVGQKEAEEDAQKDILKHIWEKENSKNLRIKDILSIGLTKSNLCKDYSIMNYSGPDYFKDWEEKFDLHQKILRIESAIESSAIEQVTRYLRANNIGKGIRHPAFYIRDYAKKYGKFFKETDKITERGIRFITYSWGKRTFTGNGQTYDVARVIALKKVLKYIWNHENELNRELRRNNRIRKNRIRKKQAIKKRLKNRPVQQGLFIHRDHLVPVNNARIGESTPIPFTVVEASNQVNYVTKGRSITPETFTPMNKYVARVIEAKPTCTPGEDPNLMPPTLCKYYLQGSCKRGSSCFYIHPQNLCNSSKKQVQSF